MRRFRDRITKAMLATGTCVYLLGGCTSAAQEFRAATADTFQTGFTTLATGLLDGIFAVYTPDAKVAN